MTYVLPQRALALVALAFVGWVGKVGAQEPDRETCATVYGEVLSGEPRGHPCQALALGLVAKLTNDFWAVGPGDLQPTSSGSSSTTGTLGQSEVVPSVQPLAVAGGSVSAVGSDAGADAITSLTFNPSIFFDGDRESVVRGSRLIDFTAFFPVDNLDRDEDGDIDYFGFRIRVNFTGLSAGKQVWDKAEAEFAKLLGWETEAAGALLDRFASMTESMMRACAAAIQSGRGPQTIEASCGRLLTPEEEDYEAFRAELDRVRTEADSRYFGLDLRLDSGDPTLGVVENAEATAITGGLAFGRQFVGSAPDPLAPSAGIRGRAGLRYTHLREIDETSFAFDGGLAFVMKRPLTIEQALMLSGGVEFRFGNVDEELEGEFQSDFLAFRAALAVPVTEQTAITISFARPLIGDEVSPTITVTADWKLLLPALLPGG